MTLGLLGWSEMVLSGGCLLPPERLPWLLSLGSLGCRSVAKPADIPDDNGEHTSPSFTRTIKLISDMATIYGYSQTPLIPLDQFSSVEWTIPCYCITIVYIYCTHVASVGVSAVVLP